MRAQLIRHGVQGIPQPPVSSRELIMFHTGSCPIYKAMNILSDGHTPRGFK